MEESRQAFLENVKLPLPTHGACAQNGPCCLQGGCSVFPNKVKSLLFPTLLFIYLLLTSMCQSKNLNLTVINKPTPHFSTIPLPAPG